MMLLIMVQVQFLYLYFQVSELGCFSVFLFSFFSNQVVLAIYGLNFIIRSIIKVRVFGTESKVFSVLVEKKRHPVMLHHDNQIQQPLQFRQHLFVLAAKIIEHQKILWNVRMMLMQSRKACKLHYFLHFFSPYFRVFAESAIFMQYLNTIRYLHEVIKIISLFQWEMRFICSAVAKSLK